MTALLVLAGGAVGAPLRYVADRWVSARTGPGPWGTFGVNVAGCFLLGLLTGSAAPAWLLTVGGTGLCGALTTFSTFSFETVRLLEEGRSTPALLNVGGSLLLGLVAAALGWALGGLV